MLNHCTNPNAPFYHLDLALLDALQGLQTCVAATVAVATTAALAVALAALVAVAAGLLARSAIRRALKAQRARDGDARRAAYRARYIALNIHNRS